MKLAVLCPPGKLYQQLADAMYRMLRYEQVTLIRCDMPEIRLDPLLGGADGVFAVVNDPHGLLALRTAAELLGGAAPIAVISDTPDYALCAIQLAAVDYLLYPLHADDLYRAVDRMRIGERGRKRDGAVV